MLKYWLILALSCFIFISCSSHNIGKDADGLKQLTEKQGDASLSRQFVLGSGDELAINIWRNDDLSRTVKINPAGNIHIPLAGEIRADGLTLSELREKISLGLSKYIINPQIDVNVSTLSSQQVHILGEVKFPGTITLERKMWVWEGISKAGGFTTDANQKKVLLARTEKEVIKVKAFNLDIKSGQLAQNLYLKKDDIIYVPPKYIADVERFMIRLNNILNPFSTFARTVIIAPDVVDILRGEIQESQMIISP